MFTHVHVVKISTLMISIPRLPIPGHGKQATENGLRSADHGKRATFGRPRKTGHGKRATFGRPRIAGLHVMSYNYPVQ